MKANYSLTIKACSIGYVVQAAVNNLLPLMFAYFNGVYKIPLYLISIIITYNFALQIFIDLISSKIVFKLGYRKTAVLSTALSAVGLLVLGIAPYVSTNYVVMYINVMVSVTFMAIGGGIIEVILSPITNAVPSSNKSSNMNLVHSFYCIGHIFVVLTATLFFKLIGIQHWQIYTFILILVPIFSLILFLICPIVMPEGDKKPLRYKDLFKNKTFILLFVLMICAGASEQAIAQWISYFAERGLGVNKAIGDVAGTCVFALGMTTTRLYFGCKAKIKDYLKVIYVCALMLFACYLVSALVKIEFVALVAFALGGVFVGIAWPGTYVVASNIFSNGGTVMFAILALGGDLGCTLGPTVLGFVAQSSSMQVGILVASAFPLIMFIGAVFIKVLKNNNLIKPLLDKKSLQ